MAKTESIYMRISPEAKKMVKTMADLDDRSVSSFIERLITKEAQQYGLVKSK